MRGAGGWGAARLVCWVRERMGCLPRLGGVPFAFLWGCLRDWGVCSDVGALNLAPG